ncbi:MAG: hypothetical protein HUJ51_01340, partial [Eggerthellaceae bacterium]|nr:hypothetical protein [Eggerthellaceae bacterium]
MFVDLKELLQQVETCKLCPLWEGRTKVVFGAGDTRSDILIIGEAPGKNEDEQGIPFVGKAGKYLDKLLSLAGLNREDVYIANVLKCRPPDNRDPKPKEIEFCAEYLRQQTRIINPKLVVTLGNFATRFILKTDKGITDLHGKPVNLSAFSVFPVYHPAAAIYDRKKRRALEKDFKILAKLYVRLKDPKASESFDPAQLCKESLWSSSTENTLSRMQNLLVALGNPEKDLKCVHVAGTNGKGSTCYFLAYICKAAGIKAGLFSSPSIQNIFDRIKLNLKNITGDEFRKYFYQVKQAIENNEKLAEEYPNQYEILFAVALLHFRNSQAELCILEVGMGGKFDSTNSIHAPMLCVFPIIDLDHCKFLGESPEAIAAEKAAIIKPGVGYVVSVSQVPGVKKIIEDASKKAKVKIYKPLEFTDAGIDQDKKFRKIT